MTPDQAIAILGINQTKGPLQNMVRALSFHSWRNTPDDTRRQEAGKYVLKNWRAYQDECNRRRDRK